MVDWWKPETAGWECWGMGLEWIREQEHRFLPLTRYRLKGDRHWRYEWGKTTTSKRDVL